MNRFHWPSALSPLSACIAMAFPVWSGSAMAQSTFSATGAFDVSGTNGDFTVPATSGNVGASALLPPDLVPQASAFLEVQSSGDGHFGGAAYAQQYYFSQHTMSSSVHMEYSDTLINTSTMGQQASFDINISKLLFSFDYGSQWGKNSVSFAANVYLDGSPIPLWSSSFAYDDGSIQTFRHGGTYTASGTDIGLAAQLPMQCPSEMMGYDGRCGFYSGSFGITGYSTSVALGSVAAGQSVGIRYVVDLGTETDMYGGDGSVEFNDPASLSSSGPAAARLAFDAPGTPGGGVTAAVPEPETYALMAAGLAALAVVRRRRAR